jgi:excisionase family DNA binding protein
MDETISRIFQDRLGLTVAEVAEALGISTSTVYRAVESFRLESYRLGRGRGAIRIGKQHLVDWLKATSSSI